MINIENLRVDLIELIELTLLTVNVIFHYQNLMIVLDLTFMKLKLLILLCIRVGTSVPKTYWNKWYWPSKIPRTRRLVLTKLVYYNLEIPSDLTDLLHFLTVSFFRLRCGVMDVNRPSQIRRNLKHDFTIFK